MKAHRFFFGGLGVLLACAGLAAEGPPNDSPTLSPGQMEEDLRQLTGVAKSAWAYGEYRKGKPGVDLDRLLEEKLRAARGAESREQFFRILKEYIAELNDGHAGVSLPGEAGGRFRWPFEVMETREGFVVNKIDAGEARVALGDKLLRVDSVPIEELVNERLKTTPSSSPGMRRHNALRAIFYSRKEKMLCEFQDLAGKTAAVELETKPAGAGSARETIGWRMLDQETGYLRMPSFRQDRAVWEKAKAEGKGPAEALEAAVAVQKARIRDAFQGLARSQGMVLDLRGNGGGTDLLGMYLSRFLVAPKGPYYALETHRSPELFELADFAARKDAPAGAWARIPIELAKSEPITPYPGKVAVLIDAGCFSATDNFVSYLACAAPGIRFVGRPNGAGSGAPRQIVTLKNSKGKVTFCVMRVWNARGELIEGNPIKPHLAVEWTRQDIVAGRDADLEAARRLLRNP